jgi:hypothetical protein
MRKKPTQIMNGILFWSITFLCMGLSMSAVAQTYNEVSFYVVAHQDDWQLFMGNYAYNDIKNTNGKTVFIYITDGTGSAYVQCSSFTGAKSYYLAREDGAMASVRLAADSEYGSSGTVYCPGNLSITNPTFSVTSKDACNSTQTRSRQVRRVEYKNTVSYFLRIPNATNPHDNSSLLGDLRDQANYSSCTTPFILTATDNSTNYNSWDDLVKTVRAITVQESTIAGSTPSLHLNIPDVDGSINPYDNWEHICAALTLLDDPTRIIPPSQTCHFQGYVTNDNYAAYPRPVNMSTEDIIKEAGLYAAYNTAKVLGGATTDWRWLPNHDNDWTSRCYVRCDVGLRASSTTPSKPESQKGEPLVVFPNPSDGTLVVRSPADNRILIGLWTLDGYPLNTFKVEPRKVQKGDNTLILERQQVPAGSYIIRITDATGKLDYVSRLVIK